MSALTDEHSPAVNAEWVVIGAMLALAGAILLLDSAGLVRAAGGWNLWPLLLVGLGISRMFRSQEDGRRPGKLLIVVGLGLLLNSLQLLRFFDAWPLLMVAGGIGMIWKAVAVRTPRAKSE